MVWDMPLWWNPGSVEEGQQSPRLFIQHSLESTLRRYKWRRRNGKTRPLRERDCSVGHVPGELSGNTFRVLQIFILRNETAKPSNVFEIAMFYAFTVHLLFWPISLPQPKKVMMLLLCIQRVLYYQCCCFFLLFQKQWNYLAVISSMLATSSTGHCVTLDESVSVSQWGCNRPKNMKMYCYFAIHISVLERNIPHMCHHMKSRRKNKTRHAR